MGKKIPFYQAFSKLNPSSLEDCLHQTLVTNTSIDKVNRSIHIFVEFPPDFSADPAFVQNIENQISGVYQLNQANLHYDTPEEAVSAPETPQQIPETPQPEQAAPIDEDPFARTERIRQEAMERIATVERSQKKSAPKSRVIYGKGIKKEPIPIVELELDMGVVVVEGDVFFVDHRELKKNRSWVIAFDVTDGTSSVRINKFFPNGDDCKPIVNGIKKGLRIQVQGRLSIDRFYNDMVLDPMAIVTVDKEIRQDTAEETRVELHLHTNMSMMDALTSVSPKESHVTNVVKRAESWGHKAIAITDHGVVHSFPQAWHSAKDIKVLFGTEAYYVNDLDDKVPVHGESTQTLHEEIVCFDLETTGLNKNKEVITEIGAVVVKNGEITDKFQTFVQPNRLLLPEIIRLTGITDEMLKDAPSQEEALQAFVDFVGGRPVAAHNADFDMGFISLGCERYAIPFDVTSVDTLVLAQNLLPELKKHKLNLVADHLNLPDFNHHRAVDDAVVVAHMLQKFWAMLEGKSIHTLAEINPAMEPLRQKASTTRRPRHLIIIAKNQVGLKNLYKLISFSHLHHFKRYPIMPKSLIMEHREGLILGSACEAGELFDAVVKGQPLSELKRIASWYDFLEIQPLCNNQFLIQKGIVDDQEDLRNFNRTVVALGKEMDKLVCATGDVHFMDPEDEVFRHILLAAKKYADADSPLPLYFKTTQEMLEEFSYLGKETAFDVVVKNTNLVADLCENIQLLPKGLFTPTLENSEQELKDLVWGKVKRLYGENPPELITSRVNTELNDIISCKYDVIYMSAQKLVQDSLDHGYLVGSRGSVGSSLVAYMSDITEVNSLPAHYRCPNCKHTDFDFALQEGFGCGADLPDKNCPQCDTPYEKDGFNIPFETFLGFGGDKVPDIDLNFSKMYQKEAHKYTFKLFGEEQVFRAGTVATVASKTAYGQALNYLKERERSVSRAEENRLAVGCTGVKRTTGQHPGGMVVVPQDMEIYDFCPVQRPADDTGSDVVITHFDYHAMEDNLLKLDILGHDDPSMIRMMQDLTGIDPQKIPLDDKDTMSIFHSSKVLGFEHDTLLGDTGSIAIPEFGTGFVRGMLLDTMPNQFDILVRLSGFSHGTDVWLGNARDLITSGTATVLEAIGCRDDIMIYLISLGMDEKFAFKIMEAVRKGRGLPEGAEEQMRQLGVPDWYTESCKKIQYLFPKAHAVAYVMMAFRIGWFKVHRPLAFYAAYFTIRAKAFDQAFMCRGVDVCKKKIRAIKEKDKGASNVEKDMLTTLEVCYEFYLRGFTFHNLDLYRSDAENFLIDDSINGLIPPFTSVAGLGGAAAESLVAQRDVKDFISVEDVSIACPSVSSSHIQLLTEAGAFGTMPATSQLTLF